MRNLFLSLLLFALPVFAQAPSAPVITSVANAITNTVTVSIAEADPGYEIHYSLDGSVPTAASPLYVAPLVLTKSATVKAIAVVIPATVVSSADFTITPPMTSYPFLLSANPASLSFTWQLGATSSSAQSLTVQDSSPCPPPAGVPVCHWPVAVTTDVPWLLATTGTTGFVSSVALNTTKLTTTGIFTGNVIFTQPQFFSPTIKIPVSVVVTSVSGPMPHTATLSWTASTSSVASYNILRSFSPGGPYAQIGNVTGLSYLDSAVNAGAIYYYEAQAVDAVGNVSANSTEVKAIIPTP